MLENIVAYQLIRLPAGTEQLGQIPGIAQIFQALDQGGLFGFVLPFLLVLAIIYGLLSQIKIFGEPYKARGINMLIGIVIALYVMVYSPIAVFLQTMAVLAAFLMTVILLAVMTLFLFARGFASEEKLPTFFSKWGGYIIFVVLTLFIYGGALAIGYPVEALITIPELIIVILIFGGIFWLYSRITISGHIARLSERMSELRKARDKALHADREAEAQRLEEQARMVEERINRLREK